MLRLLLLVSCGWAASVGLPGRPLSGQGLIGLPDVSRAFMPAGLAAAAGAPPRAAVLGAVLPVAAPLSPAAAQPSAAKAAPTASANLEQLAAGAADPKTAPAAAAATYDGIGSKRMQWDPPPPVPAGQPKPSLPAGALPLPIVRQATDYSCGAAALLAALFYWQVFDGGEQELYGPLGTTPKDGTAPWKIAEAARDFGLRAELKQRQTLDDLRAGLEHGETIIVDFQAWRAQEAAPPWKDTWDDGHYAVVAGMDDHYIYFMDPSGGPGYTFIPLAEFLDRWHDYETTPAGRQESQQLAIYLKGKTPLTSFPGPLIRGR